MHRFLPVQTPLLDNFKGLGPDFVIADIIRHDDRLSGNISACIHILTSLSGLSPRECENGALGGIFAGWKARKFRIDLHFPQGSAEMEP